jgi:hypothetical protein
MIKEQKKSFLRTNMNIDFFSVVYQTKPHLRESGWTGYCLHSWHVLLDFYTGRRFFRPVYLQNGSRTGYGYAGFLPHIIMLYIQSI